MPRILGPLEYGQFTYLSNTFTQVISFFDSSATTVLKTKLSQRPNETEIMTFFWLYFLITNIILFSTFFIITKSDIFQVLLPEQSQKYSWLALFWGVLLWQVKGLTASIDSLALTVKGEFIRMFQSILKIIFIFSLYYTKHLNFESLFYSQYLVMLFGISFWALILRNHGINIFTPLKNFNYKKYFNEYKVSMSPLIVYAIFGLIYGIFDRWLLQITSGNIQQSYFGLADQIASVCLILTTASIPIFHREVSIASFKKDKKQIKSLLLTFSSTLYLATAIIISFFITNSEGLIYIIGGEKYKDAILPVTLMLFYPIHQTYGQLLGTYFLATGQNHYYRNVGIFFMTLSLPITYFFLAKEDMGGLDMGAIGVAIKMLLIQVSIVNFHLFKISKEINISFFKVFIHQFYVIIFFLIVSSFTKYLIDDLNFSKITLFIMNFLLYGALTILSLIIHYRIKFGLFLIDEKVLIDALRKKKSVSNMD